jgi:hypothetical protein
VWTGGLSTREIWLDTWLFCAFILGVDSSLDSSLIADLFRADTFCWFDNEWLAGSAGFSPPSPLLQSRFLVALNEVSGKRL